MTGITLNGALSVGTGSQILTIPTNGDPREWLEVFGPVSNKYSVKVGTGGTSVSGKVNSISATQFEIVTSSSTSALTVSDNSAISILKNDNITQHIDSQTGFPKMVISVGDIIYPDATYPDATNKPKDIGGPAGEIA